MEVAWDTPRPGPTATDESKPASARWLAVLSPRLPSAAGPLAQLAEQRTFNPLRRCAWCARDLGLGGVYLLVPGDRFSINVAAYNAVLVSGSCVPRVL